MTSPNCVRVINCQSDVFSQPSKKMLKFMMQASPEFEGYESKDTIGTPTIDRDIVYSLNIFLFFLGGGARGGGVIELIYM